MFWVLLWFFWSFCDEITNSIIKKQEEKYNIIQIWLITIFFSLIFFILYALFKVYFFNKQIIYNPDWFLFLWIRVILEILQS